MLGLMMDTPLLTTGILDYAARAHGETQVVSRRIDGGIFRYSYADAIDRCRKLSAALLSLGLSRVTASAHCSGTPIIISNCFTVRPVKALSSTPSIRDCSTTRWFLPSITRKTAGS